MMHKHAAFSLVELSIVLVILGLLTGGILAGQSLIHASELRSVNADLQRYSAAAFAFRDKYFGIPGDLINAQSFWGTDNNGCPNGGGTTGTCNGNGNGRLGPQAANYCENQEFWRHLTLAGLIEGTYTPNTAVNCHAAGAIGKEFAKSRLNNVAIGTVHFGDVVSSGTFPGNLLYTGNYGNVFTVGRVGSTNHMAILDILTTEDAWNIDTKIDDGSPDSGTISSLRAGIYSTDCATNATPGLADYKLTITGPRCALVVKMGL